MLMAKTVHTCSVVGYVSVADQVVVCCECGAIIATWLVWSLIVCFVIWKSDDGLRLSRGSVEG